MAQQLCEVVLGVAELIGGEYRGSSGSLVTGSTTIALSIRRASDGHRLDFSDNTFKSSPTTGTHVLTETPVSSGFYVYSLDTTLLAAGQSYLVRIEDTSSGAVLDGLGGELRVCGMQTLVSTGATASGVASAVAPLATSAEVAALPTASEVTTAVWAAGSRTLTTLGTGTITNTTIADGALTAAKIAANAIGSSQIATDAIGAAQLAASAVTEIQTGLATSSAVSTLQSAVTALPSAADVSTQVAADLELAHGAGSWITATGFAAPGDAMTLSTGAITTTTFASGAITSTVFGQTAADRVWSSTSRPVTGVATGGITASSFASGALTAAALASDAVAEIVAGVWTEALPGTFTTGQAGYVLANVSGGGGGPDAATIAAAVIAQAIAGSSAGTVGGALLNLNATVSSRAAPGDAMALADSAITSAKLAVSAITAIQSGLATASALATAQSTIEALPSSRDISAEVAADLAAAHGSGAWTTASTASLATSSALAQVQADVTAMKGVGFASDDSLRNVRLAVSAIPSDLATAHGSGSWSAADVSALATTAQLGTAQTAILGAMPAAAPSASAVASAVVSQTIAGASAGSVGAALATASGYTIPTTSQITTALWDADLSGYGTYAQVAKAGGVLYGLKIVALNRMVEVAGNPGVITIYRDGGVTPYCTLQLRDATGGEVTASSGDPAQRSAAT